MLKNSDNSYLLCNIKNAPLSEAGEEVFQKYGIFVHGEYTIICAVDNNNDDSKMLNFLCQIPYEQF